MTKLVSCKNSHKFKVDLQITHTKCPVCGIEMSLRYFGNINKKFH